MNTVRNIVITLTLAAIGLSGAAQAREHGGRDRMHDDTGWAENAVDDRYGRVDRRQDRQRARLIKGRHSGELSRGELHRLKKEQKKIGRMERRFYSDGYLSGKERRRLEHAQDRASRHIAYAKHNDVYKGSRRHAHAYERHHRGSYDRHRSY